LIADTMMLQLREFFRARADSVLRSVLKNSSWAAAGQMVVVTVGMIETFVLARYLSLTDFGIFVTLSATVEITYGLLDFRNDEAVIKFMPVVTNSMGRPGAAAFLKLILLLDAAVAVFGFLIIAAVGRVILQWTSLSDEYLTALLPISFGFAGRRLVQSVGAYFRICGMFDRVTKLNVISQVGRLLLMAFVAVLTPKIVSLAYALTAANLLHMTVLGMAFLWAIRHNGLHLRPAPLSVLSDIRRQLLMFLLSGNLVGTLRMLSTKLDTILIVKLTSPAVAAIYKISARFAASLMLFSDPLLVAIYPELSHLHAHGRTNELWKLLRTVTLSFTVLGAAVIGGFAVFGGWVLETLAGGQYQSAYPVVLLMFGGSALAMIFFWARPLLLVWGYAQTLLSVSIVAFAVQVGALYLLVPSKGAVGAGISFALNYLALVGLYLCLIFRFRRRQVFHQPQPVDTLSRS